MGCIFRYLNIGEIFFQIISEYASTCKKIINIFKKRWTVTLFFVYLHQSFSLMKKDWIDKELT